LTSFGEQLLKADRQAAEMYFRPENPEHQPRGGRSDAEREERLKAFETLIGDSCPDHQAKYKELSETWRTFRTALLVKREEKRSDGSQSCVKQSSIYLPDILERLLVIFPVTEQEEGPPSQPSGENTSLETESDGDDDWVKV
jgi:hypothetical protein